MNIKYDTLPLLVLRKKVILPVHFTLEQKVSRKQSVEAIEESIANYGGYLLISTQIDENSEMIMADNIRNIGVLVKIKSFEINQKSNNNEKILKYTPLETTELKNKQDKENIYFAKFDIIKVINQRTNTTKKLANDLKVFLQQELANQSLPLSQNDIDDLLSKTPLFLLNSFILMLPLTEEDKIVLLEENNLEERYKLVFKFLQLNLNPSKVAKEQKSNDGQQTTEEVNKTSVDQEIKQKINSKFKDQQREFYLREQLKQITEELNKITGEVDEIADIEKKIEEYPYPEHIKNKLRHEIVKLKRTPQQSAEYGILRSYIDWLKDLPYVEKDVEHLDINKTRKILNKKHYGLKKPKERIIEYLAIKQQNPDFKGPILALIGPPGTGKTSLAQSIADSLGRKMVKISLGGMKDESEIRGHRRTYLGAMPGKIIQAMKRAGVTNPLILLDELDKVSSDFRGDPASAILELLDPEQNSKFQDHYLEEEYDLSQAMFIATANEWDKIPDPLFDRLEAIELSSYTELEKLEIAKKYLLPILFEETKTKKSSFKISDKVLLLLIRNYTIEAGVRQLKRVLTSLISKQLVEAHSGKKPKPTITEEKVIKYLGPKKFEFTKRAKNPNPGYVTGLAWTQYGGDIMPIEVTLYEGKGELQLTGSLKDVIKESATIALSYVKSNANAFNINPTIKVHGKEKDLFKDFDIHLHMPDGATPKDGPSAGVTFTTALISALSNKSVSEYIAMTGEITLRGKVFPIGGLREKSISAYRSGLKKIFIPYENKKDLIDIPKEVKDNLEIVPVKEYTDIYKSLFK